jgi:uncharacterized membrane protein
MGKLVGLVKGFPGHPSHPPLTDASIGAYTVGVAMLVLGTLGLEEEAMAKGALLALSGGLVLALPTAVTGLLDWLELPRETPRRRLGTIHLFAMSGATVAFAATWIAQRPGYLDGQVRGGALVAGLIAEALLTAGGYLGGTLVFVHGHRVLSRPEMPVSDALRPHAGDQPDPDASSGIRPAAPTHQS